MIRAIGYATKKNHWTDICTASFEKEMECEWRIEDVPFRWQSILDFVLEMAQKFPEDILVPIDLWDCLLIGTAKELEFKANDSKPVFNATKLCWPDEKLADIYHAREKTPHQYKYLNACGPIGLGKDIEEMFVAGMDIYPLKPWDDSIEDDYRQDTDQRFKTWIYLHGFGRLDSSCNIFQSMNCLDEGELLYVDGRMFNLKTGGMPCILHAAHSTHELIPKGLYA